MAKKDNIEQEFKELIALIESVGLTARAYFDAAETANEIKQDGSVVTRVDKEIEASIVTYVRGRFPEDSIVREEGEGYVGSSDFVWHIDPIDGTNNFLRRIPFCAISVARLGSTTEDSFGIIHNPITNQTFAALMEAGVYENERVQVLTNDILGGRAMISIARGREKWMKSASYNLQKALGLHFGGGRGIGCCSLEIAYVAANRLDGVLTFGLHSYDYGAGLYLIKAGGGLISVFRDGQWTLWTDSLKVLCAKHGETIFVSHAGIHTDALALIGNPRQWSDE